MFFSRKWQPYYHEVQFNCQFLRPLGIKTPTKNTLLPFIQLKPRNVALPKSVETQLKAESIKIILHPGSNGHGLEWPIEHFTALANILSMHKSIQVLITGSAAENEHLGRLIVANCPTVINLMGQLDIPQLMAVIKRSNALVASGTGPLHLAAAIGVHTLGLFPKVRAIGVKRWGTFGLRADSLEAPTNCKFCRGKKRRKALCQCIYQITPHTVHEWIKQRVLQVSSLTGSDA